MKKILLTLALTSAAFSQPPTVPPPILQIVSSAGKATGPTRGYAGKAAIDVLGLSAATGTPQTWMVEMHENFASIEDLDRALSPVRPVEDGSPVPSPEDLAGPPRTMIALYQPNWSYRPDEGARLLSRARWIRVSIQQIRVGLESDFGELVRLRRQTNESVNLDRPELAYHVISGAPSGTYIVLAPIVTLRMFDDGVADVPGYALPLADARAKAAPKAADVLLGVENLFFRVEPQLSYVSEGFAAGAGAFWRGGNSAQQ